MHIFQYNGQGGETSHESHFTRTSATISDGIATITRRLYFEADSMTESAPDVMALSVFPKKYAAHPNYPLYKYYGTARIAPNGEKSKIWYADLEYSTQSPNATDSDGATVTSETKPWKLKPDNIQFSYPEKNISFLAGYDNKGRIFDGNGDFINPVINSAGDKISAECTVKNIQLGFSFATQTWDPNYSIKYGNSINSKEIVICGLTIPIYRGILLPPEANYVTVYEEDSTNVKWSYWNISINIMIDMTKTLIFRKFLDIGDRAKFSEIDLSSDPMLTAAKISQKKLPATTKPSQICHFRKMVSFTIGETNPKTSYAPMGDIVFCSWEQYLMARKLYMDASDKLAENKTNYRVNAPYELQCEQITQMPLNGSGYLYYKAIEGSSEFVANTPYKTKSFLEYPVISWESLNLPKKGIDWK